MQKIFKYPVDNNTMGDRTRSVMLTIIIVCSIFILFSLPSTIAATIHGTIYDLSLTQEKNAQVEINTMPRQFYISKDGTYSLNVPNGPYLISAYTEDSSVHENISFENDGEYTIDLVLIQDHQYHVLINNTTINGTANNIADDLKNSNPSDMNLIGNSIKNIPDTEIIIYTIISMIIIILIIILIFYKYLQSRKNTDKKTSSRKKTKISIPKNYHRYESTTRMENKKETKRDNLTKTDEYSEKIFSLIKEHKRMTQKELRKEIPLSEAKISLVVTELEHEGKIKKIRKGRGNIIIFVRE